VLKCELYQSRPAGLKWQAAVFTEVYIPGFGERADLVGRERQFALVYHNALTGDLKTGERDVWPLTSDENNMCVRGKPSHKDIQ